MFKRDHHRQIATVLQALDGDLLAHHRCFFGGGTAIVLSRDEYRESADMDFLVSDREGYQTLRHLLTGRGLEAITRKGLSITTVRDLRADQYGLRTMVRAAKTEIKFEIVFEGRIQFETPKPRDTICGITTLTRLDLATSKLLANSDRWSDDSVFSRDLIDLAMLGLTRPSLSVAIAKAAAAYGASVERDLAKAIQMLHNRRDRLEDCMTALQMDDVTKSVLWSRIRKLKI